jgi:hypothetical protein
MRDVADTVPAKQRAYVLGGGALVIALLTACSAPTKAEDSTTTSKTTQAAPATSPQLVIEGSGLSLTSAAAAKDQKLRFGDDQKRTIAMISTAMGKPAQQGTNADCPSGPVQFASWSKGLTANFQDAKFVGWSGAVDLKTAKGIGFGSSRKDLVKAYHPSFEQSSLGYEFLADGISGVLESDAPDAAIADLWAGMSCVAR